MSTDIEQLNPSLEGIGRYEYGWSDKDTAGATARRGLSEDVVRNISALKSEPQWMLDPVSYTHLTLPTNREV